MAQNNEPFPARPVKVIVPFSPGGGSDTFARIMQRSVQENDFLSEKLVIVNIPGAGGTIGSRTAMNAYPDGHTILFLHDGILTAQRSGLVPYGPNAFEAVAATGEVGAVIAVGESSEYHSLEDLLAAASIHPETVSFAANIGAPSHYMALLLQHAHGKAKFRFVQSGGGAKRFGDLKGGHIGVSAFSVAEYLNFKDGGLRAIAFLGEKRHPALLDVPTARELGIPATYGNLQGWWAPKGTPTKAIQIIATALQKSMNSEEVRSKLDELQIDPVFLSGEELSDAMSRLNTELSAISPDVGTFKPPPVPQVCLAIGFLSLIGLLLGKRQRSPGGAEAVRTGESSLQPSETVSQQFPIKTGLIFLVICLYPAALGILPIRFEITTTLFFIMVALLLRKGSFKSRLTTGLVFGLCLSVVCYLFFTLLLGIELP